MATTTTMGSARTTNPATGSTTPARMHNRTVFFWVLGIIVAAIIVLFAVRDRSVVTESTMAPAQTAPVTETNTQNNAIAPTQTDSLTPAERATTNRALTNDVDAPVQQPATPGSARDTETAPPQ